MHRMITPLKHSQGSILAKIALFIFFGILVYSCNETPETPKEKQPESLIQIKNGVYTEYYPGRKAIKFQGAVDKNEQRQGKWVFYAENGLELSVTQYNHGKRDGHTIVKYPNGTLYYYGEYRNEVKVGVWKTYDQQGKLIEEKDFGQVAE